MWLAFLPSLDNMLQDSTEEDKQIPSSTAELRIEPEPEKAKTLMPEEINQK